MNGWFAMAGLSALVLLFLLLFAKARQQVWSAIAAALVLALAGYGYQGSATLGGAPATAALKDNRAAQALIDMRADMDYPYVQSKQLLRISDSFARRGKYDVAAAFIQSGLRDTPQNADLWAGLGLVLMLAGEGELSPPAKLAFAKARAHAPDHPAPDYFEGLNALLKGDPKRTIKLWIPLHKRSPANAKWKPKLESQLAGLAQMLTPASENAADNDKGTEK